MMDDDGDDDDDDDDDDGDDDDDYFSFFFSFFLFLFFIETGSQRGTSKSEFMGDALNSTHAKVGALKCPTS